MRTKLDVAYYVIYAFVNSIMCIPCLYGYAAVIFAHDVYQPHINALSKLVILSSVVHQICFTCLSTLPFAIGQVQDAGEREGEGGTRKRHIMTDAARMSPPLDALFFCPRKWMS